MRRLWLKLPATLLLVTVTFCCAIAFQIINFPTKTIKKSHDCAIILGAAVIAEKPSPVFQARIDHGITLYHDKIVKKIIFTGGVGVGDTRAESEVGAAYAKKQGIPDSAIMIEQTSQTTVENLQEAKTLMDEQGLKSALIVSDPLHLRRSIMIADWVGIDASPAATPLTKYQSWKTKFPFLIREIYFTIHFQIFKFSN